MKRASYIGFLFCLTIVAAALVPLTAYADWSAGEVRLALVVYCKDSKDAAEIAKAYVTGGQEAADSVLEAKAGAVVGSGVCAFRPAQFFVRGVESEHRGDRGSINVIRVEDANSPDGEIYYVVNEAKVAAKVERNS